MALVNVVIPPLGTPYTYLIPAALEERVSVGCEVDVPLGNRAAVGYVVGRPPESAPAPTVDVKPHKALRREHPLFLESQLEFFQWVADYYGDSLGNVIDSAIPPPVAQKYVRTAKLASSSSPPLLKGKVEQGLVSMLAQHPDGLDLKLLQQRVTGSSAVVKRLAEKGIISVSEREIVDQHLLGALPPDWARTEVSLTGAQTAALDHLMKASRESTFKPVLLHGITGSGKTEVYIEAAKEVLAAGKGVLVIVPEIALTPQLIDRFRARLAAPVAILHSGLHPRVRWDGWRALLEKRSRIGIGARSAIFAPIEDLGLIIVDEEHDSSYKQQDGLRYHARDLALVRGKLDQCPVVLGSATPSLESFHAAVTKRYDYAQLPTRPGASKPPHIEMIDLNKIKPWEMKSRSVSPELHAALQKTIEDGNHSFILYNRRGFASYLQCDRCEFVVQCPNCSVTLTLHKNDNALVCHYCGLSSFPPKHCPVCATPNDKRPAALMDLVLRGSGTERVFEELQELFPDVAMDRLDRDAVSDGEQYARILGRVRSGETKILVGTQMIAKGHDLPGVTLVGVVDCDVGLHMPDFRAGERVFQLLTQAGGRAGRAEKPGRVLLQTRVPKHPSLVFTEAHHFVGYAQHELKIREMLQYPPFARMLRIIASSTERSAGGEVLDQFVREVDDLRQKEAVHCVILGPTPAPIEKIKTLWRWHVLVKSKSPVQLNRLIRLFQHEKLRNKKVRIIFDMDPQDML
jgi:primosomal protein N' (replication factor Y)